MKMIRAGVIGVGYLGRFHAQKYASLKDDGVSLVGVVDADIDRARLVAGELGTEAFDDYKSLIDRVDVVSVVSPTFTHLEIGRAFLAAGVDVLMEKPLAATSDEAAKLIEEAEASGAILQVGHLERFNPAVTALKDKQVTPVFIEAHRLSPFPNRNADVDVVLDLMIHDIDVILNLVKSEVSSVDASGVPIITDKVDIANARIKFANGCVANVTASRVAIEPVRKTVLFSRDDYVTIDYAKQNMTISRREADEAGGGMRMVAEELSLPRKDTLMEEIKSFIASTRDRSAPLVGGSEGHRALVVAQMIQGSVERSMDGFAGAAGAKG